MREPRPASCPRCELLDGDGFARSEHAQQLRIALRVAVSGSLRTIGESIGSREASRNTGRPRMSASGSRP